MKKIKLFSVHKNKVIEGEDAHLYLDFYLVFNTTYIFTFLIDSGNIACTDRNPIRLWKHWLMMFEEEYVKYLRRYERCMRKIVTCKDCNHSRTCVIEEETYRYCIKGGTIQGVVSDDYFCGDGEREIKDEREDDFNSV